MIEVPAPCSAIIVEWNVQDGDTVTVGQEIGLCESMKMQLPIESNAAGIITILPSMIPGAFVQEGDVIATIE